MNRNKFLILSITKVLIQALTFIFLPALFISTFAGIKGLYLSVINSDYNLSVLVPQLIEAFAIVPLTLFFGRFFCGWMCAFGTLGDLVYSLSKKLFKTNLKVVKKLDGILKYAKFLVLAFLMVFIWGMGFKALKAYNPWDVFGMLATIGKKPDIAYVMSDLAPGLVILLLIIGMSFIIERFFCRYLCPLGAVFAIISKLRIIRIGKPLKGCGKCRRCTDNCPMGISMYEKDMIGSGECINCFKCTSVCPRGNVSLRAAGADVKPLAAGTMAVALMTGIYYAGESVNRTDTTVQKSMLSNSVFDSAGLVSDSKESANSNSIYRDGTYQGTGTGFRGGQTTVSVTIKNDLIADIQVISHGDDAPFFNRAYNAVAGEILDKQSTEVDAVSGATYSSMGIMGAVEDALNSARV